MKYYGNRIVFTIGLLATLTILLAPKALVADHWLGHPPVSLPTPPAPRPHPGLPGPPLPGPIPPPLTVRVLPASARVGLGREQIFTAEVMGRRGAPVQWSVVEGSACGSIDGGGRYRAPNAAASCAGRRDLPGALFVAHVRAAARVDPSKFADAEVIVGQKPQIDFRADPEATILDGETTLRWEVTGAVEVNVGTERVRPSGSKDVTVGSEYRTPFTLRARNDFGAEERTVVVKAWRDWVLVPGTAYSERREGDYILYRITFGIRLNAPPSARGEQDLRFVAGDEVVAYWPPMRPGEERTVTRTARVRGPSGRRFAVELNSAIIDPSGHCARPTRRPGNPYMRVERDARGNPAYENNCQEFTLTYP